jgi:RNA polymerase sigma factor
LRDIEQVVKEIQQGNQSLRESLIASQKNFVCRYASFICKRRLDWTGDDELSIALIAFNDAIDKFQAGKGRSFSAYARTLIKNSLIDYFRKQPDRRPLPLEAAGVDLNLVRRDEAASLDHYQKELENRDRAFELQLFKEDLAAFGLALAELPAHSPSHGDTRKYLKWTARQISANPEIVKKIYTGRRLPIREIEAFTGTGRKNLEKWRKYLLALVIIATNPDLGMLAEYIWGKEETTGER